MYIRFWFDKVGALSSLFRPVRNCGPYVEKSVSRGLSILLTIKFCMVFFFTLSSHVSRDNTATSPCKYELPQFSKFGHGARVNSTWLLFWWSLLVSMLSWTEIVHYFDDSFSVRSSDHYVIVGPLCRQFSPPGLIILLRIMHGLVFSSFHSRSKVITQPLIHENNTSFNNFRSS